jgi:outer membrane protein TolC
MRFGLYIIFLLLLRAAAFSQSPAGNNDSVSLKSLNEIVVTATRTERKLGNVAVPVTLISQKNIRQSGSLRLNEILQEQTGLVVSAGTGSSAVGGGVFGPLFNFGKNKQRVVLKQQIAEESKLKYQKSILNAVAEVENALVSVETYNKEWEASFKQTEAARTYLKLSQARYDNGYVSYLEVLDAERSLFDSELNLSRLSQDKLSAVMQLYKALGGGW